MTACEHRVQELSDLLYGIDWVCRSSVKAGEAVRLVQQLCTAANVEHVQRGRQRNQWTPEGTACLHGAA